MESGGLPPTLDALLEHLSAPVSGSVEHILKLAVALIPQQREYENLLTSECIFFAFIESGRRVNAENGEFAELESPTAYFAQAFQDLKADAHDEFRDRFFQESLTVPDLDAAPVKHIHSWTKNVERIFEAASDPTTKRSKDDAIHAYDLIAALITVSGTVTHQYLSEELKIDIGKLMEVVDDYMSETPRPPDQVPLQSDHPAKVDQLGRRAFARSLARRLHRILVANRDAKVDEAFMVHLHAPWGAGKTSLLNFLNDELARRPGPDDSWGTDDTRPWVVVTFNAWQHQHIDPPWWSFMDALYRQARDQMPPRSYSRVRLRVWENNWRLKVGRSRYIVVLMGVLWMLVLGVWFGLETPVGDVAPETVGSDWKTSGVVAEREPGGDDWREIGVFVERRPAATAWTDINLVATTISTVLALLTSVWGIAKIIGRTLVGGSASAARAFVQSAQDPMENLRQHFGEMVTMIGKPTGKPVIVLIDDIDRCHPEFVVTLLEGIQTLFRNANVMFVLAGDRRWIYTCFEKSYEAFKGEVKEPGRRLGYLFLEKAFQLSVALPKLSPTMRERYWQELLQVRQSDADQTLDVARQAAQEEVKGLATPDEMFVALSKERASGIEDIVFREQLVERMAARDVEEVTEHFLSAYAPLLEPNPRAMKRLINAYSLNEALAILAGIPIGQLGVREQLVLWTILLLRWPQLEARLESNREIVENIGNGKQLTKTEKDSLSEEEILLLESDQVRSVIAGKNPIGGGIVAPKLDGDAIEMFFDLRSSASLIGSVA